MVTYNHQYFIEDAINAIFNQTYKNEFDLIIGDDCSTDKTPLIIKNMLLKAPSHINCKYYFHENNLTGVENFNFCLSKITNGLIIVADGDDISKLDRISKIVRIHTKMQKDLYISNADEMDYNSNLIDKKRYLNTFDLSQVSYRDIYTNKIPVFGASYAFDYSIIEKYGLIDSIYVTKNNVDQNLFWRAVQNKGVYYINESLLFYRSHIGGTSISRRRDNAKLNGYKLEEKLLTIDINMNIIGNIMYLLKNECNNDNKLKPLFLRMHIEFNNLQNILSDLKSLNFDIKIVELENLNNVLNFLLDSTIQIENGKINPVVLNSLAEHFIGRSLHTLEMVELLHEKTFLTVIQKFNSMFKSEILTNKNKVESSSVNQSDLYFKSFNQIYYEGKVYLLKTNDLISIKIINFIDVINFIINGKKLHKKELSILINLFRQRKVTKREIILILLRRNKLIIGPFIQDYYLLSILVLKYKNIITIEKQIFKEN
jgi:glycosyltransferase involved in cell wall biosynthesis